MESALVRAENENLAMTLVSAGVVALAALLVALLAGVAAQMAGYPTVARWLAGGALAVLAALVVAVALTLRWLRRRRACRPLAPPAPSPIARVRPRPPARA